MKTENHSGISLIIFSKRYRLVIKTLLFLLFCVWETNSLAQTTRTVGTAGNYTTLQSAFAAINNGVIQGNITFQIISSITDNNQAILNASGSGSANYTSLTIYPVGSGYTLSGSLNGALFNFNGADNVTIDGRVNQTGSANLTITNINPNASVSTIQFINSAENNTITYCNLKGISANTAGGLIFFSTSISGNGNDGNSIQNCNISSFSATRIVNVIYSAGTLSRENSGNSITNNSIFNFFRVGVASNGINLAANNSNWLISGNSFYESTSFVPTVSVAYNVINISATTSTGITISNNFIGGSGASCSGTWTKTNAFDNSFNAINLNTSNSVSSSIQGNTIKNFSWSNSLNSSFTAINVASGAVNIGTTSPNTIGASSGNGSITLNNGSTSAALSGIKIAGSGTITCSSNIIGSLTATNTAGNASNLYGISTSGTGLNTINQNTISNLINSTTNTSGILAGIYFDGGTLNNLVRENFLHSYSATGGATTSAIYGILINKGASSYINNIINIVANSSTTVYGIYENGALGNNNNLYFNSVYLAGIPTSGAYNSYALYSAASTNIRDFRNNIFENARSNSGASGTHYAAYFNYGSSSSLTLDYNCYYAPNSGGVIAFYNGLQVGTIPLIAGQDSHSLIIIPGFVNAGGTLPEHYYPSAALTSGVSIPSVPTDYSSLSRGSTPTIGAMEVRFIWTGTQSSVWTTNENWTSSSPPNALSVVVIPDATSTLNSPTLPISTEIQKLTIESGGILNSLASAQLTINGDVNAWNNAGGTFNPNTSKIIFTNSAAVVSGTNNFYDLTISLGADLWIANGSIISVGGNFIKSGTLHNVMAGNSTIKYTGSSQTVVIPDGAPAGYKNLTLSGTGTKDLTGVTVNGILSIEGNITVPTSPTYGSSALLQYNSATPLTAGAEWVNPFILTGGITIGNTGTVALQVSKTINASVPLTINPGASLSVEPGATLIANGTLTNNAGSSGLILKSDATGDGKLIHNSPISATAELFLEGGLADTKPKFHYFIPPITSVNIGSTIANVETNLSLSNFNGDLLTYSETTAGADKDAGWHYFDGYNATTPFSSLTSDKGYNIYLTADDILTFSGTLNAGNHVFSNLDYTDLGWNLIGNPFPCNYDLNGIAELTGSSDDVDNSIYFNHNGRYVVWNLATGGETGYSDIVPPLQGFFIHVNASGASLTMPAASKTSVSTFNRQKKSNSSDVDPIKRIKLILNNGNLRDETIVCMKNDATSSFDSDYDAYKLFSKGTSTLIYSEQNSIKYAINTLKLDDSQESFLEIPVKVIVKNTGICKINISEFENLENHTVILKNGKSEMLIGQDYSYEFFATAGQSFDFQLIIKNSENDIPQNSDESFKLWYFNRLLNIEIPSISSVNKAYLSIYDVSGKLSYTGNFMVESGQIIQIPVNLPSGIYITKLTLNAKPFFSKISVSE